MWEASQNGPANQRPSASASWIGALQVLVAFRARPRICRFEVIAAAAGDGI
jgi:hypothetical protein